MGALDNFRIIIIVQLFYAFAITILTYSMPAASLDYVHSFSDVGHKIDLEGVRSDITSSINSQLHIPIIELGALVFYSGNLIIDLLLNFFFAIPEMLGLITHGFTLLFNVDAVIFASVQLFASGVIVILYFLSIIELVTNIRSRGSVV